jgi:hypothetical protein
LLADRCQERIVFGILYRNPLFRARIAAGIHVVDEFAARGDPFVQKPVEFGGKVAVGLGMAELVPGGVVKHVLGEEVLGIGAAAASSSVVT